MQVFSSKVDEMRGLKTNNTCIRVKLALQVRMGALKHGADEDEDEDEDECTHLAAAQIDAVLAEV